MIQERYCGERPRQELKYETHLPSGENVAELFAFVTEQLKAGSGNRQAVRLQYTQQDLDVVHGVLAARSDHERLRVRPSASIEEIGRAYKKLAAMVHPDKSKVPESEAAFKALVRKPCSLWLHHLLSVRS